MNAADLFPDTLPADADHDDPAAMASGMLKDWFGTLSFSHNESTHAAILDSLNWSGIGWGEIGEAFGLPNLQIGEDWGVWGGKKIAYRFKLDWGVLGSYASVHFCSPTTSTARRRGRGFTLVVAVAMAMIGASAVSAFAEQMNSIAGAGWGESGFVEAMAVQAGGLIASLAVLIFVAMMLFKADNIAAAMIGGAAGGTSGIVAGLAARAATKGLKGGGGGGGGGGSSTTTVVK